MIQSDTNYGKAYLYVRIAIVLDAIPKFIIQVYNVLYTFYVLFVRYYDIKTIAYSVSNFILKVNMNKEVKWHI